MKDLKDLWVSKIYYGEIEKRTELVVTGLAWTGVGGEILKMNLVAWKGKMQITGKLGDVMQDWVKRQSHISGPRV